MESSTPATVTTTTTVDQAVDKDSAESTAKDVPMSRLLAATAAAAAVCTPPKAGDQGSTCTRVPSGAKSQRV
ncbi:hypothetical protein [Kitasatospora kifunensis]|uniref:Uncharacterized protein n=1 Tax=Kitasatospora kifunensis TaxID=58351 RepID=A0A7W7R5H9_KITKI|nr:hypothetical protein [Kitasatospora kifunensis]MBB4925241.1 hypothetical protein [Kitasatospora kifunensis]